MKNKLIFQIPSSFQMGSLFSCTNGTTIFIPCALSCVTVCMPTCSCSMDILLSRDFYMAATTDNELKTSHMWTPDQVELHLKIDHLLPKQSCYCYKIDETRALSMYSRPSSICMKTHVWQCHIIPGCVCTSVLYNKI